MTIPGILLVEDNPADAELVRAAFEHVGSRALIVVAASGEDALAFLSDEEHADVLPQLILLDLKLPTMDGFSVLARIKSLASTRHIPVVMLTSSAASGDVYQSYRLGANCYLTKPLELADYREMAKRFYDFWLDLVRLPPGASPQQEMLA